MELQGGHIFDDDSDERGRRRKNEALNELKNEEVMMNKWTTSEGIKTKYEPIIKKGLD